MTMRWMLLVLAACGGATKAPTTVGNQGGEKVALGEEVNYDWHDGAFEADVDGDGKVETIEFGCEGKISVNVGGVRAEVPDTTSELMGCGAAAVATKVGQGKQIVVVAYEHEEVGPPHYVMFAMDGGALGWVWQDAGEITFHQGGWKLSSTECLEVGELVTTTKTMQWVGDTVDVSEDESREPIEPEGCAQP